MKSGYIYSYLKYELRLLQEIGKYQFAKFCRLLAFVYILFLFICWTCFCLASRFIKTCKKYTWQNSYFTNSDLQKTPANIAFLFADRRYINPHFISSLLYLCLLSNIDQIVLCGFFFDAEVDCKKFEGQITEILSAKGVKFIQKNLLSLHKNSLNVVYVGAEKYRNGLNQVFIKFSELDEPMKEDYFFKCLLRLSDLNEPDYFVFVGSSLHIGFGDFPSWSLRTSEFYSVDGFSNCNVLTEPEFCEIIGRYSQRNRRFGK